MIFGHRGTLKKRGSNRETLDSNDQRFSLKQWFAGGAQSRGLRKPGFGHCYLRFFAPIAVAELRSLIFPFIATFGFRGH